MKFVIDSNQLQSKQLRDFLARSPGNLAVLPDFAAMEAYKGDPLKTIFKSMEVLSDFPDQVLILKGSSKVCGLNGRRKGLQRRLIDTVQTHGFPGYVRALQLAEAGNPHCQKQVIDLGKSANEHLGKMLTEAENIRGAIENLGSRYTKEERAALRTRGVYTPEMTDRLVRNVLEMAAMIFRDSPLVRKNLPYAELPNTFVFRVTLALYLLGITRFAHGGLGEMSLENLRNDFVDMMFVAYGTFFDGVMSTDRSVNNMFTDVVRLLSTLFNAEVPAAAQIR